MTGPRTSVPGHTFSVRCAADARSLKASSPSMTEAVSKAPYGVLLTAIFICNE